MDSLIEVLDAKGNLVPRLTARPVWKSQIILFDRDSKSPGLRIAQPQVLELDDYMVSGNDLMKVVKLTNGPDEDVTYDNFGGQRLGMEDTTPEAHALDDFIYKVELHPPGTSFAPNGMPLFQFYFRNDDGGPGYGKDSRVTFTAPADGTYYARVADVRNQGGDDFAYRFTIREPVPDFLISAAPVNPNIPEGSKIPVEVTVLRQEGFEGPVEVEFDGLPEQLMATKGVIPAGERSVTLLLSLKPGVSLPQKWVRYRILGRARLGGEHRSASSEWRRSSESDCTDAQARHQGFCEAGQDTHFPERRGSGDPGRRTLQRLQGTGTVSPSGPSRTELDQSMSG